MEHSRSYSNLKWLAALIWLAWFYHPVMAENTTFAENETITQNTAVINITRTIPTTLASSPNREEAATVLPRSTINPLVFGSAILGWREDHERKFKSNPQPGYYGYGIWDIKKGQPVAEPLVLARQAGIKTLRFIGMWRDWKESVPMPDVVRTYPFGVDEKMALAEKLQAVPVICWQYLFGDPDELVELFAYLNLPAEPVLLAALSKLNLADNSADKLSEKSARLAALYNTHFSQNDNLQKWANLRALNGHPAAYNVRYLEMGNETFFVRTPESYAELYLDYYHSLKAVFPELQIGVILKMPPFTDWNDRVMAVIAKNTDFGTVHLYPSLGWQKDLSQVPAETAFSLITAIPEFALKTYLNQLLTLLNKTTGKRVPLAITEFNIGLPQNSPFPFRHTLGAALLNAEIIKLLISFGDQILFAHNWNTTNEFWGMTANGFNGNYDHLYNPYFKRPNAYLFQLMSAHFGQYLLPTQTSCDTANLSALEEYHKFEYIRLLGDAAYTVQSSNLIAGFPWHTTPVPGVVTESLEEAFSISFIDPAAFNYYHTTKTSVVEPATYYRLSAYIKAEALLINEEDRGFCLEVQDARGYSQVPWAFQTNEVDRTTPWKYVECYFKTLADAEAIKIFARRIGKYAPLTGQVLIKELVLNKIQIHTTDYYTPTLSVQASLKKETNSTDQTGEKICLIVVNRNMESPAPAELRFQSFGLIQTGTASVLTAPLVNATNEYFHDTVKITPSPIKFPEPGAEGSSPMTQIIRYTFPPHSVTAIELGTLTVP